MAPTTQSCVNCRWWEPTDPASARGECHRYPPLPHHETPSIRLSAYPATEATGWCGEHKA